MKVVVKSTYPFRIVCKAVTGDSSVFQTRVVKYFFQNFIKINNAMHHVRR